jgi:hypothetical protein
MGTDGLFEIKSRRFMDKTEQRWRKTCSPAARFALLLLCLLPVLCGCSSYLTVGRLPRGIDFQHSAVELKRHYPAFTEFAPGMKRYLLAPIQDRPRAEEIFAAWGRPDHKGMVWWWWEFPLIVNRPYYWDRAGKRVTAVISRPLFIGFQPRIYSLDVAPIECRPLP